MAKIAMFWVMGLITLAVVLWGGARLFFWIMEQARKHKLIK